MSKHSKDCPPWNSTETGLNPFQRYEWEVIQRHREQAAWIGFLQGFACAAGIAAIAFLVLR